MTLTNPLTEDKTRQFVPVVSTARVFEDARGNYPAEI